MHDKDTRLPTGIAIGYEGEQYARRVALDISAELARWPGSVPTLIYIRPGERSVYPAITELDGATLTWEPDAFATEKPGSTGSAQVIFTDPGDDRTIIGKSIVMALFVNDSLGDPASDPPEPYTGWLETLTELAARAVQAEEGAEAARDLAEGYSDTALDAKTDAVAAKEAAEAAQAAAEQSATAASGSADAAEASAAEATRQAEAAAAGADTHGVLWFTLESDGHLYGDYTEGAEDVAEAFSIENGRLILEL